MLFQDAKRARISMINLTYQEENKSQIPNACKSQKSMRNRRWGTELPTFSERMLLLLFWISLILSHASALALVIISDTKRRTISISFSSDLASSTWPGSTCRVRSTSGVRMAGRLKVVWVRDWCFFLLLCMYVWLYRRGCRCWGILISRCWFLVFLCCSFKSLNKYQ